MKRIEFFAAIFWTCFCLLFVLMLIETYAGVPNAPDAPDPAVQPVLFSLKLSTGESVFLTSNTTGTFMLDDGATATYRFGDIRPVHQYPLLLIRAEDLRNKLVTDIKNLDRSRDFWAHVLSDADAPTTAIFQAKNKLLFVSSKIEAYRDVLRFFIGERVAIIDGASSDTFHWAENPLGVDND